VLVVSAADYLDDDPSYVLGTRCWHIGELNEWGWRRIWCGSRPDPEYLLGGSSADVAASGMPVCKRCLRRRRGLARSITVEVAG
jgi:hypothetical protein